MRRSADSGFTVLETVIAASLLLVALTMFTLALSSMQRVTARQDQVGRAGDAAYQALAEMDRQLRSGYIASETPFAGADATLKDMIRFYTEAYAPPSDRAAPNTVARCVAWAVVDLQGGGQGLYTVWWTPTPGGAKPTYDPTSRSFVLPGSASPGVTNVVGSRLITAELTGAGSSTFSTLTATPGSQLSQRLIVTFYLREATDPVLTSPRAGSPSPWVNQISTTITPRNSPRSSMNADTGAFAASRDALCG